MRTNLTTLPQELRDDIYGYLTAVADYLTLMRVCRQLNQESSIIFYEKFTHHIKLNTHQGYGPLAVTHPNAVALNRIMHLNLSWKLSGSSTESSLLEHEHLTTFSMDPSIHRKNCHVTLGYDALLSPTIAHGDLRALESLAGFSRVVILLISTFSTSDTFPCFTFSARSVQDTRLRLLQHLEEILVEALGPAEEPRDSFLVFTPRKNAAPLQAKSQAPDRADVGNV